jgi:hypothetical protein
MNGFEVKTCDEIIDIDQRKNYKKLDCTAYQKIQISGLAQQISTMVTASSLNNAYVLNFPNGMSGELMQYRNGGFGTAIIGNDGKVIAHASLEKLSEQAIVMNGLAAMSAISGQYFLKEINQELKALNQSIDKILEFLYSDKKAELLAEIEFTKYAFENYSSIMFHDDQRIATIGSVQSAKKVAVKDIEFYMSDLNDIVTSKDSSEITNTVNKALQIKNCLELSIQLYVMSNLLEIYYSQNYDSKYIDRIERNVIEYLGKCEKRMLSSFSKLSMYILDFKVTPLRKIDKALLGEQVEQIIDQFSGGKESDMHNWFKTTVHAMNKKMEYYVDRNTNVYLKTA